MDVKFRVMNCLCVCERPLFTYGPYTDHQLVKVERYFNDRNSLLYDSENFVNIIQKILT